MSHPVRAVNLSPDVVYIIGRDEKVPVWVVLQVCLTCDSRVQNAMLNHVWDEVVVLDMLNNVRRRNVLANIVCNELAHVA